MPELKKATGEIIEFIGQGYYFDTHTVILLLLQKYHDTYLSGFKSYSTAELYHAAISNIVKSNDGLVEDIGETFSKNVLDNFSNCHLWRRR